MITLAEFQDLMENKLGVIFCHSKYRIVEKHRKEVTNRKKARVVTAGKH